MEQQNISRVKYIDDFNHEIKNINSNDDKLNSFFYFDWLIYINNYEDLRIANINTYPKALNHWQLYGKNEKRTFIKIIDSVKKNKNIFIITNNTGGGSIKYLDDIINHYKNVDFIYIKNKNDLYRQKYNVNDILFIQHLLFTDITIVEIIEIKLTFGLKIYISIHDFYWLNDVILYTFPSDYCVHNNYLKDNININTDILKLFESADIIIHPSKFTFDIYSKYFNDINFKIVHHNDYLINQNIINVQKISKNMINIGVLHTYSICKGSQYIEMLRCKYKTYNSYNINWCIIGETIPPNNETEFFDYIKKYNIHCLTYLNKWGETWCYSLTKGINSGLPIIYNNFGSFKERIPHNKENIFMVYNNENNSDDCEQLYTTFIKILDYIILNNKENLNKKDNIPNTNLTIQYNDFYNNIFC